MSIRPLSFRGRHSLTCVLLVGSLVSACAPVQDKLSAIKTSGELVILTRNSPTTYYQGATGPEGIEYDMAKAFADYLGVRLRVKVLPNAHDIIGALKDGKGDLAAAGLAITAHRLQEVRFAPPYQRIWQQVVYRTGNAHPRGLAGLVGRQLEVVRDSSYTELLSQMAQQDPQLKWKTTGNVGIESLLHRVHTGHLQLTIADSNIVAINRQYYPNLAVAFDLPAPQFLAWAFPKSRDRSLYDAAVKFFHLMRSSGELADLKSRYYAPVQRINTFNITTYIHRIRTRLPLYRPQFERAGLKYNIDWRLLAAMGYQESWWQANATSPTGVRGLMMLTIDTSTYVGIQDRLDPDQSIEGGAKYLRNIMNRLSPHIFQPDRTWMALAAYNMGINHLEDARRLTASQGGNPDLWVDVVKHLPLLAEPQWYSKTQYGYAPGYQAVRYVTHIQTYYNVLAKIQHDSKIKSDAMLLKLKAPAI
ncbi:MAG: membrane-bound lytic murein transglycosylase MltF [Acidiferrobacteraceae bacterium]